jgi:hypothetical protein
MNRKITVSAVLLALVIGTTGVSAQAAQDAKPAQDASKIEAGLFLNVFPIFDYTNRPKVTSTISDADLGAYYEKPTFVSGGMYLKSGAASVVGIMEFQQDIWSKLAKQSWINLPDSETGIAPDIIGLGTFYPNIGYAAYDTDTWRFSLGRRKIKSGPGTYGLGISSGNPFYDHAAASLSLPMGSGRITYDYVAVGMQRWQNMVGSVSGDGSNEQPKYLFFHRGSWTGKNFSIGLSEYNLLADVYPDFQDMSPFVFYHNLFNNHHNVMIGIDFKATPVKPVSIFGEFVMDDFQIGDEGGNPNAMGFMAGVEWRVLPGALDRKPKFFDSDYTYDLSRATRSEGLVIRAESYLASTYLWRRNEKYWDSGASTWVNTSNQAFTSRYHIMSNWSNGYHLVEPFLAAPLGPDTFLNRVAAGWMNGKIDSTFAVEYRIKGSQSEEKTYDTSTLDAAAWLWPSAPTTTEIALTLEGDYQLDPVSIASGGLSLVFKPAGTELSLSAGYGRQLGKGPSLR